MIYNENCLDTMSKLAPASVDLIITSPPYNFGINYDKYNDNLDYTKYLDSLKKILLHTHRILKPGGRICLNVTITRGRPSKPTHAHVSNIMEDLFLLRDEIIWNKSSGYARKNHAWGS